MIKKFPTSIENAFGNDVPLEILKNIQNKDMIELIKEKKTRERRG